MHPRSERRFTPREEAGKREGERGRGANDAFVSLSFPTILSLNVSSLYSFHLRPKSLPRSLSMIIRRRMNFHLNTRVMFALRHVLTLFLTMEKERKSERETHTYATFTTEILLRKVSWEKKRVDDASRVLDESATDCVGANGI